MAIEHIVRLINDTLSDIVIEDLGFVLQASENNLTSDQFSYSQLCDSEDLKDLVSGGSIIVNNGTTDLSVPEAISFLTRENKFNLERDYYNKTQLQTSGQASVNWGNIVNAPSFGSPSLINPVGFRVNTVAASAPAVGAANEVYVNTTSNQYFKSDGTSWVLVGSVASGDRIIVLDNANESIFEYSGSAWTLTDNPLSDNNALIVDDDGDGKQSQYVYNAASTELIRIGDVDFGPHVDGGLNKHTANQINIINDLSWLGLTSGATVEEVLEQIDSEIKSIVNDINQNSTDISNINGTITNIQTDIGNLQNTDTVLDGRITVLETDMTSVNSEISTIQTDITNLQNNDATVNIRLDSLEDRADAKDDDIAMLQTDVGLLNGYHHIQLISSDTWYVVHNLNRFPKATVIDSSMSNEEVFGTVQYIDSNRLNIIFGAPFTGEAFLK